MMVDIPLPPTMTKLTTLVTPGVDGKTTMWHNINGDDLTVSVWRKEDNGTYTLAHDVGIVLSFGQMNLQFPTTVLTNPNDPSTKIPNHATYKVVVMG